MVRIELTGTTDSVGDETAYEDKGCLHEVLASFKHRELRIVDVQFLSTVINAGPRCWVEVRRLTFFNVLFIAPVTPELQCDPKPTAVTRRIDSSFMCSGTSDVVPF
jgi:hypothetical protein